MEDQHVDRPDVEARQRVQLTGTNRSFGLIALIIKERRAATRVETTSFARGRRQWAVGSEKFSLHGLFAYCLLPRSALCRPGGFCKATRPDPIPNSAVKRLSANGTLSQDTGE